MQTPQTQQQFSLKWNSHQGNMLKVFTKLMQSEQFTDVTLAAEGKTLKAHRVILSACSAYFERLLSESGDKNYPIILLRDITYLDLSAIVEFMYKGEIHVTQENLGSLLKTAESLKVKGLAEVCEDDATSAQNFSSMQPADAKPGQALPMSQLQFPPSMGGSFGHYSTMSQGTPPLKKKRGRPRLFDSPDDDFSAIKQEVQTQDQSDVKDEGTSENAPQNTPPPAPFSEQASTQFPQISEVSDSSQVKQEAKDEEMANESPVVENTEEITKEPSSKLKSNLDVNYVDGEVFYCGMKVIKFNDYIQFRSRAHFWEEPVLLKMMDSVKNKTLDMKSAADLLGVSYGTLYGRYRETFGYLKHPWATRRRDSGHSKIAISSRQEYLDKRVLGALLRNDLTISQAAAMLGTSENAIFSQVHQHMLNTKNRALSQETDSEEDRLQIDLDEMSQENVQKPKIRTYANVATRID